MLAHPRALGDIELRLVRRLLAANKRHQAPPVEVYTGMLNAGKLHERGYKVLVLVVALHAASGRNFTGISDDERHVQRHIVDAMVIEVTIVVVQRLAVVTVERNNRVIHYL